MSATEILRRLRRFLLVLSLFLLGGTLLELWLVEHTQDFVQWIPFGLAGLGIVAILPVLLRSSRWAILFLRLSMLLLILGSLFGVYQHVWNNVAFEKEIHPNATVGQLLAKGFGGANPLLAPGTLGVAALLALAAVYRHSVVED
jgi:hypothetical protein